MGGGVVTDLRSSAACFASFYLLDLENLALLLPPPALVALVALFLLREIFTTRLLRALSIFPLTGRVLFALRLFLVHRALRTRRRHRPRGRARGGPGRGPGCGPGSGRVVVGEGVVVVGEGVVVVVVVVVVVF